jgi:hypothetical protein
MTYRGHVDIQQIEEGEEDFLGRRGVSDQGEDPTGVDEERGCQAARAVADVLDRAPTKLSRAPGKLIREATTECLYAGLLVRAHHRAVGGRTQVEIDDGAHLEGEEGIDLLLPVGDPMRLDGCRLEDALHAAGANRGDQPREDQDLGQGAAAPTRMSSQFMVGRILAGGGHHQTAFLGRDPSWPTAAGPVVKTVDAVKDEPPAPLTDRVSGQPQALGSLRMRTPASAFEHDQGALDRALGAGRSTEHGLQLVALLGREHEGREVHCEDSS